MLCQKGGFVKVRDCIWIEIGELIIAFGKWALLIHVHVGNFDRLFVLDLKQGKILIDPVVFFFEELKIIKLI